MESFSIKISENDFPRTKEQYMFASAALRRLSLFFIIILEEPTLKTPSPAEMLSRDVMEAAIRVGTEPMAPALFPSNLFACITASPR
jgi:hypothetical protein